MTKKIENLHQIGEACKNLYTESKGSNDPNSFTIHKGKYVGFSIEQDGSFGTYHNFQTYEEVVDWCKQDNPRKALCVFYECK